MIFPIVTVVLATIYALTYLRGDTSTIRTALKTAPIAVLAVGAALVDAPVLLTVALALSAVGDAAISRPGDTAFKAGLGAFLAAHIAYIPLFWAGVGGAPFFIAAGVMLAYAFIVARWLWPHLGDMRPPVAVYMVVIAIMGIAALSGNTLVLIGAGLFIVSDTVLAAETFVFKDRVRGWTAPAIWITYIAAQVLIFIGVLTFGL